jgi:hypothetical protein
VYSAKLRCSYLQVNELTKLLMTEKEKFMKMDEEKNSVDERLTEQQRLL